MTRISLRVPPADSATWRGFEAGAGQHPREGLGQGQVAGELGRHEATHEQVARSRSCPFRSRAGQRRDQLALTGACARPRMRGAP